MLLPPILPPPPPFATPYDADPYRHPVVPESPDIAYVLLGACLVIWAWTSWQRRKVKGGGMTFKRIIAHVIYDGVSYVLYALLFALVAVILCGVAIVAWHARVPILIIAALLGLIWGCAWVWNWARRTVGE